MADTAQRVVAAYTPLTDREREVLAFERQWWKYAGAKEEAIRELFSMSATRYYQVLNALIDTPQALEAEREVLEFESLQYDDQIAKVAVVGAGMRDASGVSAQLFRALFDAGINIEMISTSEIRISVVTRADTLNEAIRVVHTALGLDGDEEAVVHAGTGR